VDHSDSRDSAGCGNKHAHGDALSQHHGGVSQYSAALTDGEALIFHPDGHGEAIMVARVKIDEWPHMAAAPEP